jgi:hypothetical protein
MPINFAGNGRLIAWSDSAEVDPRLLAAARAAFNNIGEDIELCRWDVNDLNADDHAQWWATQSRALRRSLKIAHPNGTERFTVRRRVDDGVNVCYLRINRTRSVAVVPPAVNG